MERIKNALWDTGKNDFTLAGGAVAVFVGAFIFTWGGIVFTPLHMLGIL
jgi:hypothetical protein